MAASNLLALIDDIATILDDVAVMTKVAARKTAGVLGDDLALNAQQVAGVAPDRELPVVWSVTKGSFVNKLILVPAALAISAFAPWAVTPLLMLGGAFLCYEGFEKIAHKLTHDERENAAHRAQRVEALANPAVDIVALEKDKIKGAIRTDFILSAEIIAITLGTVADAQFATRVTVLTSIALIMTVGVYGLVAGIVKLDDAGLRLSGSSGGIRRASGRAILLAAPYMMKTISIVGTAAMFMVGGGILIHGIPGGEKIVHDVAASMGHLPFIGGAVEWVAAALLGAVFGVVAGAVALAVVTAGQRVFRSARGRSGATVSLLCASLFAAPLSDAGAASAAPGYPARPVRLIVPFAPGGSDVPARMLAQRLAEKMGQPFVVDNRPGASGVVGADIAAKATADGYTILFATASHAVTPAYYEKLPYDAVADFAPVAKVGSVPFALATHPSFGASTLKEFVSIAKAKSGQLNYGSPGTGGIGHLANILLMKQTGFQATHVAYKGTGPAVIALIAGEIHFMMPNLIGALPHLRSGKIRVLGIAADKRAPSAPDLPTFVEAGVKGAESGTWYCVLAPRGTPQGIVAALNTEITALLGTQSLRDQLATVGVIPETGTPAELASFLRDEMEKWAGVAKFAGLKKERY